MGTQKVNPPSTLVTVESGSELCQRKIAEEQAKRTENKPKHSAVRGACSAFITAVENILGRRKPSLHETQVVAIDKITKDFPQRCKNKAKVNKGGYG